MKDLYDNFFLHHKDGPDDFKFVINLGEPGIHYTIGIYYKSRTIDVHKTNENEALVSRYTPLFKMHFFSLARILVPLRKIDFVQSIAVLLNQRVKVGRLKRRRSFLLPLTSDSFPLQEILKVQRNGRRVKFRKDADLLGLQNAFLTPEQALTSAEQMFIIFKLNGGQLIMNGFAYKVGRPDQKRSFVHLPKSKINKLLKDAAFFLVQTLSRIEFKNKEAILSFMQDHLETTYLKNYKNKEVSAHKTKVA